MEEQGSSSAAQGPVDGDGLVVAHLPLVRIIAARLYRMRWNQSVEFDEYCQMGAVGLVEAARRFDPSRGAEFGTFASWRIGGAILNGLARSTELHQQIASRKRLVDSRTASLAEDGATVQDASLEAALARLAKVAVGLAVGFMLEGTGMFDDGQAVTRFDGYASIAVRQLRTRLRTAVAFLPWQERRVLEGHYFQQQAFVEIADDLGLTRGRISQIHKSALERLRAVLARDDSSFEA
ncbi:MAG TPA: sigma-70 family RNA polymerase sigma factor [Albitalea sp.]|jgi:RNA polymerase sigma factor for flagellar operon FliA|nr:sigma-70 family RNA polymerase sigma factor [Albitalea sp.]